MQLDKLAEDMANDRNASMVVKDSSSELEELKRDVAEGLMLQEISSKDDSYADQEETRTFSANQYWSLPDQYDLDELLAEEGDAEETSSTKAVLNAAVAGGENN